MNVYKVIRLLVGGCWIEIEPGSLTILPFRNEDGFHARTSMSFFDGSEVRYAVITGPLRAIQAAMEAP